MNQKKEYGKFYSISVTNQSLSNLKATVNYEFNEEYQFLGYQISSMIL
jgi:hypothetical protein